MLLQFRNTELITQKTLLTQDRTIFANFLGGSTFTLINTVYCIEDEQAYFVDETKGVNEYYQYATKEIRKLI